MPNVNDTYNELKKVETRLSDYTSELPGQIQNEIKKAWTPTLQEASGVVGKQLGGFLPSFFNIPYMQGGTTAADVSPQAKLQAMGTGLGELGGGLESSSRYADYMGAGMKDVITQALDALKTGYGMDTSAYDRAFGRYQTALSADEAAKARAMASRGGGGGGFGSINLPQPQGVNTNAWFEQQARMAASNKDANGLYNVMKAWETASGGYNKNVHEPFWTGWRSLAYGTGAPQDVINKLMKTKGLSGKAVGQYINNPPR